MSAQGVIVDVLTVAVVKFVIYLAGALLGAMIGWVGRPRYDAFVLRRREAATDA